MIDRCPTCDAPLTDGLCLTCDVAEEQVVELEVAEDDPMIGKIIADRYEIRGLHSTGGMARIYRGVQRSLDREVIIKVIRPELLAQDDLTAEEAVSRFMVEARAASRLNHPNVVSVYDFGQTSAADGGQLFMVMEYLAGADLWTVHHRDLDIPFTRIADILKQALSALGEAHHLGMAHRDVKPENIIIEATRAGNDLVKVIDFGLAKLNALQSVTRVGQTLGTPHYMAPEQISGAALGSGDLYAVGVILFELLTGEVPFDGSNPVEILRKHIAAPRPDPREVAPQRNIPLALANVCMRAMHVDPAQRWPDAESLAAAIQRAAGAGLSRGSLPDIGPSRGSAPPLPPRKPSADRPSVAPRPPAMTPARPEGAANAPLLGREADLAFARTTLAGRRRWIAITGGAGAGRSRLLREVAAVADQGGALVVSARSGPARHRELRTSGLQRLICALTAMPASEPRLASGAEAGRDADAAAGLRAVFAGDLGQRDRAAVRGALAAAFAWAARHAAERAPGGRVVLALDDADRLDNASLRALVDGFARAPAAGFFVVATSEEPVGPADAAARRIEGLGAAHAAQLGDWLGCPREATAARRAEGAVEPLWLELVRRFRLDGGAPIPARLVDLVQLGFRGLSPAQRRLLVAVAVIGGAAPADLRGIARREDLDGGLGPLVDAGVLEVDEQGEIWVTHEILARVALGLTPGQALAQLHGAEAARLASMPALAEPRAYHAARGVPDFETFLLVEECAAARAAVGDDAGVVAILEAAMEGGRALLRQGDLESGSSACTVFGTKLGAALRALDRFDEALAVLQESLDLTGPVDRPRALVLEELARAAGSLGHLRDAVAWRQQALAIARKIGDRDLVARLVAAARE
jgi:serine/threonine-protein kinase